MSFPPVLLPRLTALIKGNSLYADFRTPMAAVSYALYYTSKTELKLQEEYTSFHRRSDEVLKRQRERISEKARNKSRETG